MVFANTAGEYDDVYATHFSSISTDVLDDALLVHLQAENSARIACVVGIFDGAHVGRNLGNTCNTAILIDNVLHIGSAEVVLSHQVGESARVDVATASAHDETFGGGETHRSVYTLAVEHSSDATAVAYVASDNLLGVHVYAEELANALRNVAVACAVESVATHAVFGVELIRKGIHIRLGRHGLVESGVEHSYLRHVGQHLRDGVDTCNVHRIVKRSYVVAFFYLSDNLVGDEHALIELFATMHHAVTYGVNLVEALDAAVIFAGEEVEDSLDGAIVVGDVEFDDFLRTVGKFKLDESAGKANFFDTTFGKDIVSLNLDEFVFYGATSAVEH